jgi:hypothetical protein
MIRQRDGREASSEMSDKAEKDKTGGDHLGVSAFGEAAKIATQGLVDGLSAVLSRICLPAAEEFGLAWRDRVANWRASHALEIAKKAQEMLGDRAGNSHAHPRLVIKIIDDGSWSDDKTIQSMWAGLLSSSCTTDGRDESNLMFISLLGQLTSTEVRLLNFACQHASVSLSPAGLLVASGISFGVDTLTSITHLTDFHRMDREIDHLRSLGLLGFHAGFENIAQQKIADLTPSAIGLHLYARSQGHSGSVEGFYGLKGQE